MNATENGNSPASTMTKREAIAAQILAGLCGSRHAGDPLALASLALLQADALIFKISGDQL